jgi:hypothetical protein
MVPLGVLRRRECSAWSWACSREKVVVMRWRVGTWWALRMAKARGVESAML